MSAEEKQKEKTRVVFRKRKARHAGHHGGAWKVAYADFVTAMMALFMVLWLLTQADMKLRSQIAQYFRNPGVLPGGSLVSEDQNPAHTREPSVVEKEILLVRGNQRLRYPERHAEEEAAAEQERLEGQAKAIEQAMAQDPALEELRDQVIVEVHSSGLSIQVIDRAGDRELLFDLASAELKPPLVRLLQRIAAVLGELPNPVQVGGHTDARPYASGSRKTNWQLSFERADNARRVIETNGLRPRQVTRILAYADSEPLVEGDPLADENRRLSILAERTKPVPATARPAVVLPPDEIPKQAHAAAGKASF